VPILGKSKAHRGFNWWFVQTADGNQCYVSSDVGTTSGDTSTVPDRAAPTLSSWQGVWRDSNGDTIEFRSQGDTFEWSTDWDSCDPVSFDSTRSSVDPVDESLSGQVEQSEITLDGSAECALANTFSYDIAFAVGSNHNQFVGYLDGDPYCGYRNGAGFPEICSGP